MSFGRRSSSSARSNGSSSTISQTTDLTDEQRRAQRKRQLNTLLASFNKNEEIKTEDPSIAATKQAALKNRALLQQQQRDQAINERKRVTEERQRQKDQQARELLLKREQEAESKRLSDQKAESDRRREEWEAKLVAEAAAQQRREVNALKLTLAIQHRNLILVIRDTWLPWRAFVQQQRAFDAQALTFVAAQRQVETIKHMRSALRIRMNQRALVAANQAKKAEHFAIVCSMRRAFARWNVYIERRRREQSEALQLYQRVLVHKNMLIWIAETRHRMQIRDEELSKLETTAIAMCRLSTQRRVWQCWKQFMQYQRDERDKEQLKAAMLAKVSGWLKEYNSSVK